MRLIVSRITEYKLDDLEKIEIVSEYVNAWTSKYRAKLTFTGTVAPLVLDTHGYVSSTWSEVRSLLTQMREAEAKRESVNISQKVGTSGKERI